MRRRRGAVIAVLLAAMLAAAVPGGAPADPAPAQLVARPMIVIVPDDPTAAPGGIRGYVPSDLRSAYGLDGTSGQGRLVAIIDAFDDPNAESDLGMYRSAFGLPPCTSANGCFRKLDAHGGTSYPRPDVAWAREVSLDLDMLSAACPDCRIALVEGYGAGVADLGVAVGTAASLPGIVAIGNSYGVAESPQETQWDGLYHHPGIAVTAASGDGGYGTGYPAASPQVTAVGGTTLRRDGSARGWSESPWAGASSGCSRFEPKPSWQHDAGCPRRMIADVSADADPTTGVAMYDSYSAPGWAMAGGTSAATAFIAGVYALAGNTSSVVAGSYPYAHSDQLNVVGGGYTPPAGLGTPSGTGAF
ncbi:MAG TPA: peptidase S8 [Candidatus Dormibacteraeota bacterium]